MTKTRRLQWLLVAWLGAAMFTVASLVNHSTITSWVGGLWAGAAIVLTLLYLEIRR